MFEMQTIASVDKSFRSLIQNRNYEKYVYAIISRSEVIFRGVDCQVKLTHFFVENETVKESL